MLRVAAGVFLFLGVEIAEDVAVFEGRFLIVGQLGGFDELFEALTEGFQEGEDEQALAGVDRDAGQKVEPVVGHGRWS
ncbi:hypothetical protein [Rhodothermus marinus]|uniref:hypothetical protein n=1 Tax=Rhodothermus marinus TaxID=29549 RepID=UPI000AA93337|nr:hypothetical protein [Rhodothermus marinus]